MIQGFPQTMGTMHLNGEDFENAFFCGPFSELIPPPMTSSMDAFGQYDSNGELHTQGQGQPMHAGSQSVLCEQLNKSVSDALGLGDDWQRHRPDTWSTSHVTKWVIHVCHVHGIDPSKVMLLNKENHNVTGTVLMSMQMEDFRQADPTHGELLFGAFQGALQASNAPVHNHFNGNPYNTDHTSLWCDSDIINNNNVDCGVMDNSNIHTLSMNTNQFSNMYTDNNNYQVNNFKVESPSVSERDSDSDSLTSSLYLNTFMYQDQKFKTMAVTMEEETLKMPRKRAGRPPSKDKRHKNKNGQRNGRLWEFIRDLLLDSKTCPSLLKWENIDEGIFRFVQSDKVARLWGERKCNPRMNYEKLSRAMRYYYKSQVFLPVLGRRLVYRFGPNATGWRPQLKQ